MTAVRLHLADAPTDVLVYLAGNPQAKFSAAWIAGAVAPDDAEEVVTTVALALRLLHDAGYVKRVSHTHWQVSAEGVTAVREAVSVVTASQTEKQPHSSALTTSAQTVPPASSETADAKGPEGS